MSIITFFDLVQNEEFRTFVQNRLINGTKNPQYSFSDILPILYKYRPLTEYSVNDIIAGKITATNIGDFNDLFDGSIHQYGTEEEREYIAETQWNELEQLRIAANIPDVLLQHDHYVELCKKHLKADSVLKFRQLDYLGTYVCCFSTERTSTLMWSHYANSNTGICIEYDFNNLAANHLYKKMIFPVAYSNSPINLHNLLTDEKGEIYKYPLDAAVLCAALNKADVWKYENEWRLVFMLPSSNQKERRMPLIVATNPSSISFGYHFIRPCFYYNHKNQEEIERAEKHIQNIVRLLDYILQKQIPISLMVPSIGEYKTTPKPVSIKSLRTLFANYFKNDKPQDMKFYYVIHDQLMNLV